MLRRFLHEFTDLLWFLATLFGFMFILLILADSGDTLLGSAVYYFWLIMPLFGFGILFGTAGIIRKLYFKS